MNKCHPLHGQSRDPPVFGPPAFHSLVLVLMLTRPPQGGLGGPRLGHGDQPHPHPCPVQLEWQPLFSVPTHTLAKVWVSPAGARASWVGWSTPDHNPRAPPPPCCKAASSLSLEGSDLPSEKTTSTFFFCILINTEEAGAVKFILGKLQNWFIWCCGTSYCFQYTISNQPFCILVFSFHFDKHCNYSY